MFAGLLFGIVIIGVLILVAVRPRPVEEVAEKVLATVKRLPLALARTVSKKIFKKGEDPVDVHLAGFVVGGMLGTLGHLILGILKGFPGFWTTAFCYLAFSAAGGLLFVLLLLVTEPEAEKG